MTWISPKHLVTAHFKLINFLLSIWWEWLFLTQYSISTVLWNTAVTTMSAIKYHENSSPITLFFTILSCPCAWMRLKCRMWARKWKRWYHHGKFWSGLLLCSGGQHSVGVLMQMKKCVCLCLCVCVCVWASF